MMRVFTWRKTIMKRFTRSKTMMKRFLAMFKLEIKKILLVPLVFIFGIIFPPFIFVLQMENAKKIAGSHFSPLGYIPMLTVLTIVILCLTSLPIGLASDRENKYFKRLRMAGVSQRLYLLVHYSIQLVLGLFTFALLIIIASVIYKVSIPYEYLPSFFIVLLVLHMMLYCIGVVIGNTSSDVKTVQTRALIVYFILIFLGDLTFPISTLGNAFQKIAWFLPTTYGVELLKEILIGGGILWSYYIFAIIGVLIVFGYGSIKLFKWE